jgi:hypothetical protein
MPSSSARRDSYESQEGQVAVWLDPVGMLDVSGVVDLARWTVYRRRPAQDKLLRSTSRTLQTTEQIQNQKDYENGSDYAVRPVAESITACRESPD